MEYLLPQEIQVRYILPAIRGELAKSLVSEQKLSQKEAARLLGITEAAISYYISKKRGNNVSLSAEMISEIKKSAEIIKGNNSMLMHELVKLVNHESAMEATCLIHMSNDSSLKKCRLCFEKHDRIEQ